MLREFPLADVLTLANAACGLAGVFFAMEYMSSRLSVHFFAAAALSPAALTFDWFDGRVARWRHQQSVLGRELDSLADIISFGVAPAALVKGHPNFPSCGHRKFPTPVRLSVRRLRPAPSRL